jgi:DNA-directed RNA polymerase specialized sigma24 family protein
MQEHTQKPLSFENNGSRAAGGGAERGNLDEPSQRQRCEQADQADVERWESEGGRVLPAASLDEAAELVVDQSADRHSRWIIETLRCFLFAKEEAPEFGEQVIAEIERRLTEVLRNATLAALLPAIRRGAERFYRSQEVSFWDAEDLAGKLVVKVLDGLSKGGPTGNPGAWISRIRFTILMDFWRIKQRERNGLGIRQDAALLAEVHDASLDEASLRLLFDELPTDLRRLLSAESEEGAAIAEHYQQTVDELTQAVQSLEWPEGSSPLKRRRRRRSS